MLACLALALTLMMRLWPKAALSRFLHRHLVERPVAWCATVERHRIIFLALLVVLTLSMSEVIAVMGSEVVVAYAFDLSLYIDALFVTAALAAASYVRSTTRHIGALARLRQPARLRQSKRRERTTRSAARKPADNEDGPAPQVALAA